ncbi:MAG: molybdopterin molybdotransferase MoeA [Planctomycetia bacterium]|nr:molybdopterin molybdotransferase MoeA [Planctomycetia bacterium]
MHGFAQRVTVEAALIWLEGQLRPLPAEQVPLASAAGRVLASPVTSSVAVPGFDRAMMDGFALRAANTAGATPYNQLQLDIVGESFPGRPFAGQLGQGQAVRIMTGAPLPAGADSVLPAELAQLDGPHVRVHGEVTPGKHVGSVGEDVSVDAIVFREGRTLRPQDLGVLSSIGAGCLPCVRRPRASIVVTGNELLPGGTKPHGFQVTDANGPMLAALVERDGGSLAKRQIVPDDREAILAALLDDVDVVLVSGGSSVGEEDHVPTLLAERGELAIHGIAMRPSSPTGMGRLGARLVFLLPGNPVSCLCAYDFFAGRAIRGLGGRNREWPYRTVKGKLTRKISSEIGRLDYARVVFADGAITPLAIGGASILSSTTRADGFLLIPADLEGYPPGAEVNVFLYD